MKKLFLDIETIPADVSDEKTRSALEYLFERKKNKHPDSDESWDEFVGKTSFDGSFGRIACIAYAVNDEETRVISDKSGEKKLLEDFWFVAGQCDQFIGHNVIDFDLRFILQRSVILGVKPTWNRFQELGKKPWEMTKYLSFARYANLPIFDTMQEWSNWGSGKVGLEHLALALGIPTPKTGIDGSEVAKFYADGKIDEICEYCKRDVDTTRAVYKRIVHDSTAVFDTVYQDEF
jgi:predicted PolB exonuclease-like 3'-5' exonuclease